MSKQDRLLSDEELFDNNFGAWLEQHGVELSPMLVGEKFVAHIDLNELKPAIMELINTQKKLYAESVIGEDEEVRFLRGSGGVVPGQPKFIRNQLRAEQRASMATCVSKED